MGRPERPVDPEAGPVQRLAHELRTLRYNAGGPSYRVMAKRAHVSVTALSQAAGGEQLPTLAVVLAYARACDGDPAEWELLWKEATAEAQQLREDDEETPPYHGLRRFEPCDHRLFFGRERLVEELLRLVHEHRFTVVFGASGSGKSSLLRAGLIPRLLQTIPQRDRPAVLRVLTPGAAPATTYGRILAPEAGEPESWVVVDQFEEVFTSCRDHTERARFLDLLLTARKPDSRLRVVIAVRADFYGRCAEHRGLAGALRDANLLVDPMTPAELREAVVRPALAAGLLVERALTARIVEEVADQPGGLPMFSHALLETWRRRRGRKLTLAAYEQAGGVHGAIAATAENVYGKLSVAQARTARQVLLRLVEPGQGTADSRRPVGRAELEDWPDPEALVVIERLARARLLTVDAEGVELAHEALITCWPRLHGWIGEDRERLRHHRLLTEAARAWVELGRDPGALYRGTRLARTEELFPRSGQPDVLCTTEREYLTAALDTREAEHRAAVRNTRRARLLTAALSGVVAVALVAGMAAWQQHRGNERQHTETTARRVGAISQAIRTADPRTAMLLGVAAWRIAPLPEARSALLGALAQPELDTFTDPAPGGGPARFLADSGNTLVSVKDRTWRTWDVATHRLVSSGRLPAGQVLAASPDARVLAVSGDSGWRLWDTHTGSWTGAARPLPPSYDLRFGSSGSGYLAGSPDGDQVQLRSVADGRLLFEAKSANAQLATSADDRLAAVCPSGRSPTVVDIVRHHALPGGWERARGICDDDNSMLVFGGSNGDRLAAVSDTTVRVWDTASGRQLADIDYPNVKHLAFTKDGAFLAASGSDEIRVWRLTAPTAPVFRHALNSQHLYGSLAWDASSPILRYLEGGTVHSLDLTAALTHGWRSQPLNNVLLSPDGRLLATAERSGGRYRFQLRAARDGHLLRTLPSPPFPAARDPAEPVLPQHTMSLMAFSPDSTSFTYGISAPGRDASPQRFVVWDLTRDRKQDTLDLATPSSAQALIKVALGPGGRTLYACRTPGIGHLRNEVWDTVLHRRTAVLTGLASSTLVVRPDGRLLVGDSRVASLPSGLVTTHDLVQGQGVGALTFSPDGSLLAAGDQTGRVVLWDAALRYRKGLLPNVFPAPLGDTPEAVSALAVSPDGRTLAVAGDSGTLQLWDTATHQRLGTPLTTPGETIRSLAFSPDSGTLYAASDHIPIQRYIIAPSRAITQICARTGTNLTKTQWHTYIPDAPYRRVCDPASARTSPTPAPASPRNPPISHQQSAAGLGGSRSWLFRRRK